MKKLFTRDWLIKELASRASFTQGDVKILWITFEEIVQEIIQNEDELLITGLFKLYVRTIEAHKGYDATHKIPIDIPEKKRIVFGASRTLLDLFKK